jgi:site-specific recombinase XerD
MMLEELQRRNYAQNTVKGYLRIRQDFAEHFHQRPNKLGPDHLRQYQAHLFQDKKLNAGTVQQYVAALRFFFIRPQTGSGWLSASPSARTLVQCQLL